MLISASYSPDTISSLLVTFKISTLLSPSSFKDAWFARFWADYGSNSRDCAPEYAILLTNQAYGVVIEVGPGNGAWVGLYDKEKVTRIYGIEPNQEHHMKLRQKIIEAGLTDIYILCGAGAADLEENWVNREEGRGGLYCDFEVCFILLSHGNIRIVWKGYLSKISKSKPQMLFTDAVSLLCSKFCGDYFWFVLIPQRR